MTRHLDTPTQAITTEPAARSAGPDRSARPAGPGTERERSPAVPKARWWRRPWVLPLAALVVAFLALVLPPWLSFDPARSPVDLDERFPVHYQLLWLHVVLGAVTYLTVCLQLWPWLRSRYPAVHRVSGRIYVFGGMLPAATLALVFLPSSKLLPVGKVGTVLWATLGLVTTIAGYRAARQGRWSAHRKWMLYSFALAMNVITGRALSAMVFFLPVIGDDLASVTMFQFEGFWLGWMLNMALVTWFLRRRNARPAVGPRGMLVR
jgi:uncharacterized membrane protein